MNVKRKKIQKAVLKYFFCHSFRSPPSLHPPCLHLWGSLTFSHLWSIFGIRGTKTNKARTLGFTIMDWMRYLIQLMVSTVVVFSVTLGLLSIGICCRHCFPWSNILNPKKKKNNTHTWLSLTSCYPPPSSLLPPSFLLCLSAVAVPLVDVLISFYSSECRHFHHVSNARPFPLFMQTRAQKSLTKNRKHDIPFDIWNRHTFFNHSFDFCSMYTLLIWMPLSSNPQFRVFLDRVRTSPSSSLSTSLSSSLSNYRLPLFPVFLMLWFIITTLNIWV